MDGIFRYLDKSLKEVYSKDLNIIHNQSIKSVAFRLGVYLNKLLVCDLAYRNLYVDYKFKNKEDYLDLVIHNRRTKDNIFVIHIIKEESLVKDGINKIKLITNTNDLTRRGVLIVLHDSYYESFKLSPKHYEETN